MTLRRLAATGSKALLLVRQGWLLWGVTLVLFLVLEGGYRAVHALRVRVSDPAAAVDSSLHPYATAPWWPELQRDLARRHNRYDAYRTHWSLPLASRYVNIDTAGRRVTPQPVGAARTRPLFLLGGSVAWGYQARDSATIGAFLAAALTSRGIAHVEVVNLAQAAYNSTQETATLLLELAHGHVPALAIFLDGYNDVATAAEHGVPGQTYSAAVVQRDIDLGQRNFGQELLGLGRHSLFIQRVQRLLGIGPSPTLPVSPAVCRPVADYYRALTLIGRGLGHQFGFPVLYFLQPHHAVTGKALTRWERTLPIPRLVPPCYAAIDSALSDRRGMDFFTLNNLFDADSATVFLDAHAHLTEAANRRVAERIAALAAPLLLHSAAAR